MSEVDENVMKTVKIQTVEYFKTLQINCGI